MSSWKNNSVDLIIFQSRMMGTFNGFNFSLSLSLCVFVCVCVSNFLTDKQMLD